MLTEKENFLRALGGEVPEYIPRYNSMLSPRPAIFAGDRVKGVGRDIFGVEWSMEGSAVEAAMPKMDKFILEDIRDWRDVIKFPDFSGVDWESMAKNDKKDFDPANAMGGGTSVQGFFQSLMAFMGFTNGLIAIYEEPEEVKALNEYLCDCYLSYADAYLKAYQPDYINFGDDIAHERAPFISLEAFQDIYAPVWRRYISFFKERGYLAMHHNCGKFDLFVDDVVDMGFNGWEPAQPSNDLAGIKEKYGNQFLITGSFETRPFIPLLDVTEEQCRQAIRDVVNKLAVGGGYCFITIGYLDKTPIFVKRMEWINDEFEKLRMTFYK